LCSTLGKACFPRHPAFQSIHPQAMAIKLGGSAGEQCLPLYAKPWHNIPLFVNMTMDRVMGRPCMHASGNRFGHPHQCWPCI
jgi:hypothetical protein